MNVTSTVITMTSTTLTSNPHHQHHQQVEEEQQMSYLLSQGFTRGLARTLLQSTRGTFALRVWIIDNSGSMTARDGHCVVSTQNASSNTSINTSSEQMRMEGRANSVYAAPKTPGHSKSMITMQNTPATSSLPSSYNIHSCTRWEEICDSVRYHANLSAMLHTPTIFRLLNQPQLQDNITTNKSLPQQFSIAQDGVEYIPDDLRIMEEVLQYSVPRGVTPLTRHIREIRDGLASMAEHWRSLGQKVCIVIATDGLPTDEEGYGGPDITNKFMAALKSLEGLPVWVVIRLCTDEPQVCEFYNDLDGELEISLDVVDDYTDEASEVEKYNPWLNYGFPIQRLRELGFHDRVFDMIDERPLTKGELYNFCCVLFGATSLPDPSVDWISFVKALERLQKGENKVWNPIRAKMATWIDLRKLHEVYGDGSKCVIM